MKSIASIVLILMFGFSGLTASAQSSTLAETWESAREKASIQTDATVKKNYLDKALSLAAVPEEKVVSYLELSVLRYEQKIFGESHYFADLALQLVEKELPNNEELRTQAIAFKSEALAKLGRADEANKIIVENVERTSRKSDHVWSSGNKRMVHKFSHLQCPDAIGGMFFLKHTTYNPAGIDVGCSYGVVSEHRNTITLYMTKHENVDNKSAIQGASAPMINRHPDDEILAENKKTNFGLDGKSSYYTLLNVGSPQSGETYTGAWTKVVDDWVLKTRLTWAAELGPNFGADKSKVLFATSYVPVRSHLDHCNALDDKKKGQHLNGDDAMTLLIMESALGDVSMNELIEGGEVQDDGTKTKTMEKELTLPQSPNLECFAMKSGGNEIALAYHPGEDIRYSFQSTVVDGFYYVTKQTGLMAIIEKKKTLYMLKAIEGNRESLLQIYDGEPEPILVFGDTIAYLNGEADPLSSVEFKDNGDTNIIISEDVFDETE